MCEAQQKCKSNDQNDGQHILSAAVIDSLCNYEVGSNKSDDLKKRVSKY